MYCYSSKKKKKKKKDGGYTSDLRTKIKAYNDKVLNGLFTKNSSSTFNK